MPNTHKDKMIDRVVLGLGGYKPPSTGSGSLHDQKYHRWGREVSGNYAGSQQLWISFVTGDIEPPRTSRKADVSSMPTPNVRPEVFLNAVR